MNHASQHEPDDITRSGWALVAQNVVERIAHPLMLAMAFALWLALDRDGGAVLIALISAIVLMEMLERIVPAKPRWHQTTTEKLRLIGLYFLLLVVSALVIAIYEAVLLPTLAGLVGGQAFWPSTWPILVQVLMLYFMADFIYYWIHRGIHNSGLLWRISGHGMHHAFHNLHALNAGATHPLEVLFLALPMVILAAIFGAPVDAIAGAQVLLVTNAVMAHANVSMDTPLFNWFFTNSNQHRRHHSNVFEQSNSNYACNAILWDRLFGTYNREPVEQTGIGPTQPTIWQMMQLPWREPEDADTVAERK